LPGMKMQKKPVIKLMGLIMIDLNNGVMNTFFYLIEMKHEVLEDYFLMILISRDLSMVSA